MPPPSSSARIRSVTVGINPDGRAPAELAERLTTIYGSAESSFAAAGLTVQTRRLTLPIARASAGDSRFTIWNRLQTITRLAEQSGARWVCQSFALDQARFAAEWRLAAVEVVRRFPSAFVNLVIAENDAIYHESLGEAAQTILDVAGLSANGFDNFRVGVGCQLRPNTPFFPFSYHDGSDGFSFAVEIIETALQALERLAAGVEVEEQRAALVTELDSVVRTVDSIGRDLEAATGLGYRGLDMSLAPFPDGRRSLATLYQLVGLSLPGHAGTVAVTSFFTNILKHVLHSSGARAAGFNGVMFSPLEDHGLAAAGNARALSLDKLLGWSTVCGCGIDMVPLAGDVMRDELAALILDTAATATVLRKPLGVRVLPIPGASVNELTSFNHDFLVNTRILPLAGERVPLSGTSVEPFRFLPLQSNIPAS